MHHSALAHHHKLYCISIGSSKEPLTHKLCRSRTSSPLRSNSMSTRGTPLHRSKNLRMVMASAAAGTLFVMLLASRSSSLGPISAAPAVRRDVKQPRRGLSVAVVDEPSQDHEMHAVISSVQDVAETLQAAYERPSIAALLPARADVPTAVEPRPQWSSVQSIHHSPLQRNDTRPRGKGMFPYAFTHVFENIQLSWVDKAEIGVVFFYPANETIPDSRRIQPKEFRPEYNKMLRISTLYQAVQPGDESPLARCDNWVNEPALVWHIPYPDNVFHFLNDGFVPVLHTLLDSGLRPAHIDRLINAPVAAKDSQCLLPTPVQTEFELLMMRPDAYHQPWSFLLDHITTAQSTLRQRNYHCFRKLIVGANFLLDLFEQGFDAETLALRKPALDAVQKFMVSSALTNKVAHAPPYVNRSALAEAGCSRIADMRAQQARNDTVPAPGGARRWLSGGSMAQVTLAARSAPESRSILNERDLQRFLEAHWEVTVVSSSFNRTLFDTIDLLQRTDVFLGMHGAGFTNTQFLPQGSAVVQLMPYAWNLTKPDDKAEVVVRAKLYQRITEIVGIPHYYHINPDAKHAFFRKMDFESIGEEQNYRVHPEASMQHPIDSPDTDNPPPYWIYQDTFVDLSEGSSLRKVIEKAFAARGIPRRQPPLPFTAETPLPPDPPQEARPNVQQVAPAKPAETQTVKDKKADAKPADDKKADEKKAEDKKAAGAKADSNKAPAEEERWTGIMVR